MKGKTWLAITACLALVLAPSYVRAYRVDGASDAPSYLMGDRVLVNHTAYDLRFPYADFVLFSHSHPAAGDVVIYSVPRWEHPVLKRVVGVPGDVVEMRNNHLTINGRRLTYGPLNVADYRNLAEENDIGSVVEVESGQGSARVITHTPDRGVAASFDPVLVPDGHYFLLGDNRDHSRDSRHDGTVPRERIRGRVTLKLTSAR